MEAFVARDLTPANTALDRHREKVARISAQLRRHVRGRPLSLRKRSVSHQVPKANDLRRHDDKIDLGALTEILSIDPVRRICVAESGVTFVDLFRDLYTNTCRTVMGHP